MNCLIRLPKSGHVVSVEATSILLIVTMGTTLRISVMTSAVSADI